ncbi:MAG: hypothetical protein KIS73_22805 [Enhydrobacter sp.]|nr:hypothetical protein [Enhydrobacter sp.]
MRLLATAALMLVPAAAVGQTAEWTGTWKIVNGTCREGLTATVVEVPGTVTLKGEGNGRDIPPSERVVRVAADGSGRGIFPNPVFGDLEVAVPPGRGKRPIKLTQQTRGICQWELR